MSDPGKAVFLSYASQDSEAAKKICDALRTAGVEVWFDQSELVGGDAWDQKIRRQIGSCALLIPIISANTQARREGYFRLEWRLAVERMRQMDDDLPFLLPVVIDGTKDAEAFVPDRFREVQWTRLKGGETPPAFCGRVKNLLGGEVEPGRPRPGERTENRKPRTENRPRSAGARWWWLAFPFFGLSMALILYFNPPRSFESKPPATGSPPAAPLSKARELAYQARTLIENGDDANRETFATAEELLKRAVELDPSDGEATAIYAQLVRSVYRYGYDQSDERDAQARKLAERAVMLAPKSLEAQFALACDYYRSDPAESERRLRELLAKHPDDKRLLRALGVTLRIQGRREEAVAAWRKAADLPGSDAESLAEIARTVGGLGRYAEAEAALDRSLAMRASGRTLMFKMWLLLYYRGDVDAASAMIGQWPAWAPFEDRGAYQAATLWLWRRDPDKAIAALERVLREQLNDNNTYVGPKRLLTGRAHQLAGRSEAARNEWKRALQLTESMLKEESSEDWLAWRAWLQAALGERAAAEASRRVFDQTVPRFVVKAVQLAGIDVQLGDHDSALAILERFFAETNYLASARLSAAALRLDPAWDPLRKDPRFQALQARVAQAETGLSRAAGESASAMDSSVAKAREDRTEDESDKASLPDSKSVAVLPFANLSGDPAQEYFSDGLTEEILTALSAERDLQVPGRTSVFSFKGKAMSAPEVARALNVAQVVEGSVRKSGSQVRIAVSLTRARDGFSEPLGMFTEQLDDIFALQEKVARAVVEKLTKRTTTATGVSVQTKNPAAYDAYLRARARQMNVVTSVNAPETIRLYEEAIRLDPQYALPWARISQVYEMMLYSGFDRSPAVRAKAQEAAATSLRLNPELPEAHLAMAMVRLSGDRDLDAAQAELNEAERLRPNDPEVPWIQARIDYARGRSDDTIARLVLRSAELDPQNAVNLYSMAAVLGASGRFAEADRLLVQSLAAAPNARAVADRSINYLAWTGDTKGAWEILAAFPAAQVSGYMPFFNVRALGRVLQGDVAGARTDCEQVRTEVREGKYMTSGARGQRIRATLLLARLEERQGNNTRATALLSEALEEARQLTRDLPDDSQIADYLAQALASLGQKEEARVIGNRSLRLAEQMHIVPAVTLTRRNRAHLFALLGETEAAVTELRAVHEMGYAFGYRLRHELEWEPLRGDPKFQQLMKEAEARADAVPRK